MAANAYTISFINDKNTFILTNEKGKTLKVNSKHKKYEWLQDQEKGKVVKISESGRWTSSKDYDALYDAVKILSKSITAAQTTATQKAVAKTSKSKVKNGKLEKAEASKTDNSQETIAGLQEEITELQGVNIGLQKEVAGRQKEITSLQGKLKSLEAKNNGLINAVKEMKSQKENAISNAKKLQNFYDNTQGVIENRDQIFRDKIRNRGNMSSNDILEVILRLKKGAATPPKPSTKPSIKSIPQPVIREKDYEVQLSYSLDEGTGSFKAINKGWSELKYASFIYKDIKAPSKTLAKQLATYYLLNRERKMDEKFKSTEGLSNFSNCKKVRVEIISIK
jgi:chromosome segregation ATPase|tara:strand:+ start:78 stop:1088 length:1011 start_codon:yes stop_codon:yes gene_type:complete